MRRHPLASIISAMLLPAVLGTAIAADAPPTTAQVTEPVVFTGQKPGSDYFLANYTQTTAWLKKVATESDRMKLVSIGKTSEGRDQWMAIVSSPENIRKLDHYREISKKLALAKGLTESEAHALAQEGRAVLWIDAGLHATEVTNAQAHLQIVHEMLTKNDPETLRLLGDDIILFAWDNPDGLELVANWYMRDPHKVSTDSIPILYHHYVGHDNNRDSYAANQIETANINRVNYIEWFPQILYNEHQTGPVGAVVFIPPFRDPYNYNQEPLIINQTDVVGEMMHARLVAQNKPGSAMRSAAAYSTWFNGAVRTVGYFHNQIGILTEIIGNPTPMSIPLIADKQLAHEDEVMPSPPQEWHFQQSLDYIKEMDRAVMDYASRYREVVLYNRYVMGHNQIQKGSEDSWIITPERINALKAAAAKVKFEKQTGPLDNVAGYDSSQIIPTSLYNSVLHDPAYRAPRAYIIPADEQPDMPTTIKFLNSLYKNGIEIEKAPSAFSFDGRSYPAGTYVVRTDQAFRPHVLDMFEPQDHPQDFAYPGGPPVRPYDITGYTLALQMNVKFDRQLDAAPPHFPAIPGVIETPPPGQIIGSGRAGWVVSHATNNSFTLTNRLLKAKVPVYWLKGSTSVAGRTLAPGALWIPASAAAQSIVTEATRSLGLDAYAEAAKPAGDSIAVKPVRVGLVDIYGGSMASGWTRWLFEKFEFPYKRVYPQELDKGGLNRSYDVLIFQDDILGREGRPAGRQPEAADIPEQYRPMLGRITHEKTFPAIEAFAKAGGTVIAVGNSTPLGADIGVPVSNILVTRGDDGKEKPIPGNKFYIPGSLLTTKVDTSNPLAYGVPETLTVFYFNNPVYEGASIGAGVRKVGWFYNDNPLVSGWAWGQKLLNGNSLVLDASLGKGHVFLLGPEVTQRGQPYPTFKFLFNGIFYGPNVK